jgi:hypothetical protein
MRLLRYLYRSVNLSNIILAIAIILVGIGALSPYIYGTVRIKLPPAGISPVEEEKPSAENAGLSPQDYTVVAEQNLFHPERRIPPETKEGQQLAKPELILYGTLLYDGVTAAYVEDKKTPVTSPGRGKRQTVLKKGEAISGFVLKEVSADHIILWRGDEKMVVHLNQGEKPRTAEKSAGPVPVPKGPAAGSNAVARPTASPVPKPVPVLSPQARAQSPDVRRPTAPPPSTLPSN